MASFFAFGGVGTAWAESIQSFQAVINIQPDGIVAVEEVITYDFGAEQRHGIFRDIPLTSPDGPTLVITPMGVLDGAYQSLPYSVSTQGDKVQIKIGDPDVLISGVHTYLIDYEVKNAIRFFNDHDELYWNVTGTEWPVDIGSAYVSINLPRFLKEGLRMGCFTGPKGSTEKNCQINLVGSAEGTNQVNVYTSRPLNSGEGLTVVVGLPVGIIDHQGAGTVEVKDSFNWSIIFVPGFMALWLFVFVKGIRRKLQLRVKPTPKIPRELKSRPVVVEYNPPDDLPPIEVGTLLDRRVDITDISSVIMDLAVRGYLKIRYITVERPMWPDKKDYELVKLKSGDDLTHPADKILFEKLFSEEDTVLLSSLEKTRHKFYKTVEEIKKETEEHLYNEQYFDADAKEKGKKWEWLTLIAITFFFLAIFLKNFGQPLQATIVRVATFVFLVISMMIGIRLNNRLTSGGVNVLAKILGFREFLQLTEKDKLEMLNAPHLEPETFEKFLPYAMVLGVEKKWAEKFEGIYQAAPTWYEDQSQSVFSSVVLTRSLTNFDMSFNRTFNISSPRSSSGFSGGSSGGGSGGGGGGSW